MELFQIYNDCKFIFMKINIESGLYFLADNDYYLKITFHSHNQSFLSYLHINSFHLLYAFAN
jgi:hypothetical protein